MRGAHRGRAGRGRRPGGYESTVLPLENASGGHDIISWRERQAKTDHAGLATCWTNGCPSLRFRGARRPYQPFPATGASLRSQR